MTAFQARLRFRVPCLMVLLPFLAGCAASLPTGRFDSLAKASNSVLQSSTDTYTRIEGLERQYMVFNPAGGPYSVDTFKPVVDGQDFDFGPRLRFREAALDVLARYADALAAFAKKDYQAELDKATQQLDASVLSLSSQLTSAAQAKQAAGALATAVNALGRVVVERKRREALTTTMKETQGAVQTLANLIVQDNDLIKGAVVIMRNGILRVANGVRPPERSIARLGFDDGISRLIGETNEMLASLESLNTAVRAIPAAHMEIQQSLEERASTLAQLQALIAEAKRLATHYRGLK